MLEFNVSISDEKPVPSPLNVALFNHEILLLFQSQMRSQFPRHGAGMRPHETI